jgi:uncharacterized phiE125 gp8 family phage protein
MSSYATLSAVKAYLRVSGAGDDTLLTDLVTRASRMIDDHCGRWFITRQETRAYDAIGSHITGRLLLLDADLLSLTSLTNGDGAAISPQNVILRPVNWPPYFGISLRQESGLAWTYSGDPVGAISVAGTWGYSQSTPEPVVHATVRLAAWLYRQRDNGSAPEGASAHLPPDVRDMLMPYIRLQVRAVV